MILRKMGNAVYQLDLPSSLDSILLVFHVLMLKKCVGDPPMVFSLESVSISNSLSYEEVPIEILDLQVR